MSVYQQLSALQWTRWINKYVLAFIIFVAWLSFFDKNNLIVQSQLHSTVQGLEEQIADYEVRHQEAQNEKMVMQQERERYAREKYFMHKADEEVFILE